MMKWKKMLMAALPLTLLLSFHAFAGQWNCDMNGWWYQEDDGSYLANGWFWLDGNGDGTAECYYFGKDGYLVKENGYVDGYQVDENGAWMVDGKVQTKQVERTDNAGRTGNADGTGSSDNAGSSGQSGIPDSSDPAVLFRAAAEKNKELDQVDGTLEMTVTESSSGVTIAMSVRNSFKAHGLKSGNLQFVSKGNMSAFGIDMPVGEFYTDGFYYSDSGSRKYREPMSGEEALAESMFYEAYLLDDDDVEYAGAFSVRQEGENKVLCLDMNSGKFKEESGFDDDDGNGYQIHSAVMELVINPDGYCIAQRIHMDVDETGNNTDYGRSMTINKKLDAVTAIHNPGQPVDIQIPSMSGYEEIYALK